MPQRHVGRAVRIVRRHRPIQLLMFEEDALRLDVLPEQPMQPSHERIEYLGYQRIAGQPVDRVVERRVARCDRLIVTVVEGTATLFANWAQSYLQHPNQLPPSDQALCQSVGGDPNIFYYHSAWELADDEALVVHLPRIPDCRFWNLQIDNWWMESLDYRYDRICHNQNSTKRDADGGVTMIVSHRDPGAANWLDTAGLDDGLAIMRWQQVPAEMTNAGLVRDFRVVKLSDLAAMPGLPRVTPGERRARIVARAAAYNTRVG